MSRQVARLLVPVVVVGVALTGCGRSDRNSDEVVPVATSAPASTTPTETGTGTNGGDTTVPASTTPVVITVDPAVDQALAELEELTRQIEADLKAGSDAAANGG